MSYPPVPGIPQDSPTSTAPAPDQAAPTANPDPAPSDSQPPADSGERSSHSESLEMIQDFLHHMYGSDWNNFSSQWKADVAEENPHA